MEKSTESRRPPEDSAAAIESVLIVDDDEMVLDSLALWIQELGAEIFEAHDQQGALEILQERSVDALVTDLMLPDGNGIELMSQAKAIRPDLQVVILTSYGSVESAIEAIRAGAFDYLQKPAYAETIQHTLRRLARQRRLQQQVELLQSALRTGTHQSGLVARSHQMRHILEQVELTSDSPASVLIEGASGTGKEAVARAIHEQGPRAEGPFVAVSCDAIGPHEQARFLFGDGSDRLSAMEKASGGILYLRQVQTLGLEVQQRLLQFLQDHTVRDEDGLVLCRPDLRVVAGSEVPLHQVVEQGLFRRELYYKLAVFRIQIPPLHDRTMDILALADLFARQIAAERNLPIRRFHPRTLSLLMEYSWPRNVPELRAAVFDAALASQGPDILPEHLPVFLLDALQRSPAVWKRSLKDVEREHIARVLDAVAWNRTKAAEILGIRRMTLYNKIKEYGLTPP